MRVAVREVFPSFGRIVVYKRCNYKAEKCLIDGAGTQAHSAWLVEVVFSTLSPHGESRSVPVGLVPLAINAM